MKLERGVWVTISVGLLIWALLKTCNEKKCPEIIKEVHDTTYIRISDTSIIYQPEITKIIYVPRPFLRIDSFIVFERIDVDTAEILKDYFAQIYYSDTQKVEHGQLIIDDVVTENRIMARRLTTDFNIPTITNTVTLKEPKRNQVFGGIDFLGDSRLKLFGAGGGLSFKDKKDRLYDFSALYTNRDSLPFLFQVSHRRLISFKKK